VHFVWCVRGASPAVRFLLLLLLLLLLGMPLPPRVS